MPRASKDLLPTLQDAWKALQRANGAVPDAMIEVGSGTGPPADIYASPAEIFISRGLLRYGSTTVMTALAHDAAHLLARAAHVTDTARGSRYHNDQFRTFVGTLGFTAVSYPSLGYAVVKIPDPFASRYHAVMRRLGVLLPDEIPVPQEGLLLRCIARRIPGRGKAGSAATCECPKPRTIRLWPGVLARGPITCGICAAEFLIRDPS